METLMKTLLLATTVAFLAFAPAFAQQGQQPAQAPSVASPTGTSAPPDDPFRNAGRPESHGGTVHAPQVGAASASAIGDMRQAAEALAQNTVTAQQYGNLASMRHASGAIQQLGDRMIVTNSRINKALAEAYPELRRSEQMRPEERGAFDNLARGADENEFGARVAQGVSQNYPQAISALERLGQDGRFRELAGSAVPELRAQLNDANRILQTANASPAPGQGSQPTATGSVAPQQSAK
jgi:hypothetical protein